MSVHEYARREQQNEEHEERVAEILHLPTTPKTGPEFLEEHAQILVDMAINMRSLAELWRAES